MVYPPSYGHRSAVISKKFILVILLISCLTHCSQPPAEQAIRTIIDEIEIAIEGKNTRKIIKHLSPTFQANGYMDKQELRKYIAAHFLTNNNIHIIVTKLEIVYTEQNPYFAQMKAVAAVTGADRIIPDDARLLTINGEWINQGGDWLLNTVEWQ